MLVDALFGGLSKRDEGWQYTENLVRDLLLPSTKSGQAVTPMKGLGHTPLFRAYDLISGKYAQCPVQLRRKRDDGGSDLVTKHWAARCLGRFPNPEMDIFVFKKLIALLRLVRGQMFCEIAISENRSKGYLYPLVEPNMTIRRDPNSRALLYTYSHNSNVEYDTGIDIYFQDELLTILDFTLNGIWGESRITRCREAIGLGMAYEDYQARFIANDATPRGFLKYPAKLSKDTKEEIREHVKKALGGKNRGTVGILDSDATWIQAAANQADAQFLEGRTFQIAEVSRMTGVPLHKLGELTRSTNNNVESQNLDFMTDCFDPFLWSMEAAYDKCLLTEDEIDQGFYFTHDLLALIRADMKTTSEVSQLDLYSGIKDLNEARASRGLNPVPENMRLQNLTYGPWGTKPQDKTPITAPIADQKMLDSNQIKRVMTPIFRAAFERIYSRETKQLENLLKKRAQGAGSDETLAAIDEFYAGQAQYVAEMLRAAVTGAFEWKNDAPESAREQFLKAACERHVSDGKFEIRETIRRHEPVVAWMELQFLLEKWSEKGAQKRADAELENILEVIGS